MRGPSSATATRLLAVSHEATRTGAPMVLLRLLQWLRANREVEIEVLLLRGGPLADDFAEVGTVHRAHAFGFESVPEKVEKRLVKHGLGPMAERARLARLRAEVRDLRGYDVLYCNSMSSSVALRVLPELPPTVLTHVHELDSAVARWLEPTDRAAMINRSDAFVVAADCVGRNLVENHRVDPARVHRCYEFVDRPVADPDLVASARDRLGIGPDELVVGAAGTADWRKGADLFLQVAARVRRAAPGLPVRFVWVGRVMEHEGAAHRHDVEAASLDDLVTFVGEVPDPASYVSQVDVFCLTSREDPFPLVCLEAGALGVPVVTFDNGGMVELASAGDGEPLLAAVPYMDVEAMADAVITLLRDRDGARRAGARLRDWVVDHHLSGVGAAEIGDLVDRLAGRRDAVGAASAPRPG
jgi:glycosyltransferase involved in cell wall biosynthesis